MHPKSSGGTPLPLYAVQQPGPVTAHGGFPFTGVVTVPAIRYSYPGMNTRISRRFNELRASGKRGFVAYVCAGDPTLKATADSICQLEDVGVDVVELGVPFSDPLADGKVNQLAAQRALDAGATVAGVLEMVAQARERAEVPIILFTYLNPLFAYGYERLCRDAARAGVDGILPLDLPVEEGKDLRDALAGHGLDNIGLVAPTSTDERIRATVRHGSGFVYCVSRAGVTGVRAKVNPSADLIRRVRACTTLPTALGFGVSNPAQARAAVAEADAVVVGSAIVQRFFDAPHTRAGRKQAAAWVGTLVRAVKEV